MWEKIFWLFMTKKQKAQKTLSLRELEPEEFVTLKCKVCGHKTCLNPKSVLFPPTCECGNNDSGDCRNWLKGEFGNFQVVEIFTLRFPPPGIL